MANQYVNKVVKSDGTTIIDITDTTAVASDVAQGKYFYLASGQRVEGEAEDVDLQTKSVSYTPSESQQTASITADTGYDGLEKVDVTVNAISSDYVGSGIDRRSSTDITISGSSSGAIITAPAGYYESNASKILQPASTRSQINGDIVPTFNFNSNTRVVNAIVPQISVTTMAYDYGYMPPSYTNTQTLTPSQQSYASYTIPSGRAGTPIARKGTVSNHEVSITPWVRNGAGYIDNEDIYGDPVTITAAELESGTKSITANGTGIDVTGYAEVDVAVPSSAPTLQTITKTYTPTESQQTETIVASSGYDGIEEVDVTVNAIPSNYVGSGIDRHDSADLYGFYDEGEYWVGGDAGYYAGDFELNVPNGTEGTPTATKGTVSNHAVSVTPSVTNSAGYITGGTKTGTAVTVSASELVSGTLNVTSSGTKDVTDYASTSVPSLTLPTSAAASATSGYTSKATISRSTSDQYINIPTGFNDAGGYYKVNAVANGTEGTPTATKGTVSNHSVSVTPSVTNVAGYISGGTKTGTAVTVSASELVSGSQTITENDTYDVTNLASITVAVEGGSSGVQTDIVGVSVETLSSSITFTGLKGEPTSFILIPDSNSLSTASPPNVISVVFDGTTIHGQTASTTSNANASYDTGFTKSYSNGTLTITATTARFVTEWWSCEYTYGGSSANIDIKDVQVGSGATSITFTGLDDEPIRWSCIFKSNFGTSSGYQRVMFVRDDQDTVWGYCLDSSVHGSSSYWTASYSNGSLTITSQGTNQGGYFHQPGYYQLTAVYGGEIEPTIIEVEPISITQNGTYTAPTGKAYSPVTVTVSGGGANFGTVTTTNSSNQNTSISFTLPSGRTPKAFFARLTSQIARNSSNRYYYVYDMRWDGSSTGGVAGNTFYMYNGTLTDVTSGYSYSQSGTTFTLSTTGTRSTSPGSFYNGTYEMVYVY